MAYKTLEKLFMQIQAPIVMLAMTSCCASALLPTARCGLEFTLSMVNCSLVFL